MNRLPLRAKDRIGVGIGHLRPLSSLLRNLLRGGEGRGFCSSRDSTLQSDLWHTDYKGDGQASEISNSVEHYDDDWTQGTDSARRKKLRRTPRDAQVEH